MKSKKGEDFSINGLVGIAIIFLVLGIVLVVSSQINQNLQDNIRKTETITKSDEAFTPIANKYVPVSRIPFTSSGVRIMNTSGGLELKSTGNWTADDNLGINISTQGLFWTNLSSGWVLKVNYTYGQTKETPEYNITSYSSQGFKQLGSNLPTLAVVIAAVIIIGIMYTFYKKQE